MTKRKQTKAKKRLIFTISDKSMERVFKKMLSEFIMAVAIKEDDQTKRHIFYPIRSLNVNDNTITYVDGDETKTIEIEKVISIDIKTQTPTFIVTRKGSFNVG